MPKVVIDGKEYDTEKLPKEALELINSIQFIDREVTNLQNQIKIHLSARNFYFLQLKQILSKGQEEKQEEKQEKKQEEADSLKGIIQDDKIKF